MTTLVRRLWVDDERNSPMSWTGDSVYLATTSIEAINIIRSMILNGITFDEISLDHDLGLTYAGTGMDVLNWMIKYDVWPEVLTIHTQNPVARQNMLRAAHAEAPDWVDIYTITW